MQEFELTEQALSSVSPKRTDWTVIKTAEINGQALAIEGLTRALEELIDARNRHTAAIEREAKALRELEDAKVFAEMDSRSRRIPAQSANVRESRSFSIAEKSGNQKRKRG